MSSFVFFSILRNLFYLIIAFDPYTHGYYKVTERVGEAFKDGLKLKK